MRPTEKKIQNLIQNFNNQTRPELDEKILDDCFAELGNLKSPEPETGPKKWRMIMKNPTTKISAAAAIILIGVLVLVHSVSITPAFAIEQTIETIGNLKSLHVSGVHIDTNGELSEIEIWTRVHSEIPKRSGDFREEVKGKRISVASERENVTYRYFPEKNQVIIMTGLQNSVKPFWPDGDFFRELKDNAIDWRETQGKDQDGNACIIVTCDYQLDRLPGRYFKFWFQFDPMTMLPTSMKIRDFKKSQNAQEYYLDVIEFNVDMADSLFEYTLPEEVEVIENR